MALSHCKRLRTAHMPPMSESLIIWTSDSIAGVPLRRALARVGEIDVGDVAYDGSNRLWTWSSPLADDAWGHATTELGAKQGFEVWLRGWLSNFAPFFQDKRGCATVEPVEDLEG
jgi:hypothetical protein